MAPTTLFLFLLFTTLFIGGLFRPIIGILGYLSVYIIYDGYAWWCAPIKEFLHRPSLVASIFLIVGCILHRDKLNWHISRREIEFYLFLGTAWIVSCFFGVEMHQGTWKYLEKILKGFVFIFFFLRVVNTLDRFKLVTWGYIVGGIFLSYQAHNIGKLIGGRLENIGGTDFIEANSVAAFLAFTMIMLSFELVKTPLLWRKGLFVIGLALIMDSIVLTQSRAVFMGLLLSLPYILLRTPKVYRKQIYLYVALGAIMFFTLTDKGFLSRVGTIGDAIKPIESKISLTQEKSLNRIDYWKASIRIFADHPFGVGVNNFQKIVPYYDPRNRGLDAHNTFVLCYSEIGIIGIVLFIIIILETFFQLKRIRQMVINTPYEKEISLFAASLATSLIAYILGGMMTHSYLYLEITWMLLALPICLENATRKLIDTSDKPLKEEINSLKDKTTILTN